MNTLSELNPKILWENFAKLCDIPRPSHHCEQISGFLKSFGEKLGLETIQDEAGNIIIRKPATKGKEGCKTVILQAHMDMVPQKNSDVTHDFLKDPIQAYVDGEWVTAKGTTLGADNGMGIAAIMAVLEAKDIEHGPIEALITVDEEDGMDGAVALKKGVLTGDVLINVDSEEEDELTIGCAGGINTDVVFEYSPATVPANVEAFKVNVAGLKGGHSGGDIHLGRGNANKLINRLLWQASRDYGLRLASIDAGGLRNAIPREAVAIVVVPNEKVNDFLNYVKEFTEMVKLELEHVEPDVKIQAEKTQMPENLVDETIQNSLFDAVYACLNGVIRMSDTMSGLVETSTNLGVTKSENNKIMLRSLQRSSLTSAKRDVSNAVKCAFDLAGAKVTQNSEYPGWQPNLESPILRVMKRAYKKVHGEEPKVVACHGGLECGLFLDRYPNLDAISCGPTIRFPHSPDEKINIASVKKFWDFLIEILKNC